MAIRNLFLVLLTAALATPSVLAADHEHRATVLMRNGDRVSGLLEDVEHGHVYVRVSQNDQRKLPVGDVALIDLAGGATGLPETELSVARRANHLTILRDGSSITGNFIDIRGGEAGAPADEPHALIFRAGNGEERRIRLDHVSRIYFGNFPGSTTVAKPTPDPGGPVPAGSVRVPGNAGWVATPLFVRRGDVVSFSATGRVRLSEDAGDVAEAAGSVRQRSADNAPIPGNLAGALIAKVGNSAPFPIGNQTTVRMPANGQLYLGVNDDHVGDNGGEFIVTLSLQSTNRR